MRQYLSGERTIFGKSRSEKKANAILGVVQGFGGSSTNRLYRSEALREVEKFVDGSNYDGKHDWDISCQNKEDYIPIHKRKPKIIYPFAEIFSERLSSKLSGNSTFPKFKIEDDREADYLLSLIVSSINLKQYALSLAKLFCLYNSAFIRFYIVQGRVKLECFNSNYCYPTFSDGGELESVVIKYTYLTDEYDQAGKQIKKWYKIELSKNVDLEFDSPEFSDNTEPVFTEVSRSEHGLGYVQGEWFTFGDSAHGYDGDRIPFILKIKGFIDAVNYNLSQSDKATQYGLEPQLVVSGMTQDEIDDLIKSSSSSWALGRDGTANYLEVAGAGVATGHETRNQFMRYAQDIARIIMIDPEKAIGTAQSAKAMEVMHGPMVEMINEMRPWFEKGLKQLLEKIYATILILNRFGFETQFTIPDNWEPQSLTIKALWPPIFELTTIDKQQVIMLAVQASNANIISRDTALKWLQSQGIDFGVENFELEQEKINTQQRFSTFF